MTEETSPSRRHVADALRIHVEAVRGPERSGSDRARLDERHRVALLHPEYDGFLVLHVTALADIDDVRVRADDELARIFTPHHIVGPLRRDQVRSFDLEIHPKAIGDDHRVSGLLHVVDSEDADICPPIRFTLATDRTLECTLAGRIDGPWDDGDEFDAIAGEFANGTGDARSFVRRIEQVEAGKPDPRLAEQAQVAAPMSAHRDTSFEPIRTTADERDDELFGVHIPELQLDVDEYRAGFAAADLADGERYLELGSGHGNGLVIAAREFGATAVGIEYLDDAIERARAAARRAGVEDRVELIRDDLRRIEPTAADVVHMHLGPAFHDVLAARMEESLTPTARVIAAGWRVPGWRPVPGTAERWDGGYIYRPADPRMHISWFDERNETGEDVIVLDARVHADIEAIEPRFDTDGPEPVIELSDTTAFRGQRIAVAVSRTGFPVEVSLWGRSRSGRLTQRGSAITVD